MNFGEIFVIVAIVAFILEILTPTLFFSSIALAALITAVIAVWFTSGVWLTVIWAGLSVILLLFVRPLVMPLMNKFPQGVEFNTEYIGQNAKVIEEITATSGSVAIYGERWDARLADENAEAIQKGAEAKIVRNESIVLYVEKA